MCHYTTDSHPPTGGRSEASPRSTDEVYGVRQEDHPLSMGIILSSAGTNCNPSRAVFDAASENSRMRVRPIGEGGREDQGGTPETTEETGEVEPLVTIYEKNSGWSRLSRPAPPRGFGEITTCLVRVDSQPADTQPPPSLSFGKFTAGSLPASEGRFPVSMPMRYL